MIFPYCRKNSERISCLVSGEEFHCHRGVPVEREEYMEKFSSGLSYNNFNYNIFLFSCFMPGWHCTCLRGKLEFFHLRLHKQGMHRWDILMGLWCQWLFHCSGSPRGVAEFISTASNSGTKITSNKKYIHPESKSEQILTWDYEVYFFLCWVPTNYYEINPEVPRITSSFGK